MKIPGFSHLCDMCSCNSFVLMLLLVCCLSMSCAQGEIVTPGKDNNATSPDLDMDGASDFAAPTDDGSPSDQGNPVDMKGDQGGNNNTSSGCNATSQCEGEGEVCDTTTGDCVAIDPKLCEPC